MLDLKVKIDATKGSFHVKGDVDGSNEKIIAEIAAASYIFLLDLAERLVDEDDELSDVFNDVVEEFIKELVYLKEIKEEELKEE